MAAARPCPRVPVFRYDAQPSRKTYAISSIFKNPCFRCNAAVSTDYNFVAVKIKSKSIMRTLLLIAYCCPIFLANHAATQNLADSDATFTEYFRRDSGWTAGDATISIPLTNDSILWLFGDSYIDGYNAADTSLPCMFQVRNAGMLQHKNNPGALITLLDETQTGLSRSLFKLYTPEPPNHYFWPGHGYAANDTAYVFLNRYRDTTEIDDGLPVKKKYFLGTYLAKMTLPDLHIAEIIPLPERDGIIFGRWVLVPQSGQYAFIYGNRLEATGNLQVWKPYVARVLASNPLGPWQFRTANGWSANPQNAVTICPDFGVSPGFSVCQRSGRFYLFTQENGYLECGKGRKIYAIGGSSNPWSSFTERLTIFTIEDKYDGEYLSTYNTYAHPEWNQNGALLLSYNVNDKYDVEEPNICPSQCFNVWTDRYNADTYRPKFIRLPWSVLTGINQKTDRTPISPAAVSSGAEIPEVECSPNPSNGRFNIAIQLNTATQVSLQVLDLTGKVIYTEVTEEGATGRITRPIDITKSPAGIYLLRVNVGGREVVKRLVKQKG